MEDQSKKNIAKWTIGISHLPEMEGKARAFFPTHDFDIIKHHREYVYKKFIVWEFANDRVIKRVKTTDKDFKECRNDWLNDELKEIERIINIPGITRSDQIELKKYRDYVNEELNQKDTINLKPLIDTLEKACKGTPEYDSIKAWFIDKGFCDPVTLSWKDRKKGNKSILVNYLYDLHEKGYTYYLTQKQIQVIAENSFGFSIGIDMIKQISSPTNTTTNGKFEIPHFKD